MKCIGLTGGIGCGKSTVARFFEELGAQVIDTDEISRSLTQQDGSGIALIRTQFGPKYITKEGSMDRALMRHLIIADVEAKQKLQAILHPLILAECKARIDKPGNSPYTLLMAPLLLECPEFLQLTSRVLLVDCDTKLQVSRVQQRNGLEASEIRAIIAMQMPRQARLELADDIVLNNSSFESLTDQVKLLHLNYINKHLTAG